MTFSRSSWSPKTQLVVGAAVLFVGFGAGFLGDPRGLRRWNALGDDLSRLETENAQKRAEIEALRAKARALRGDVQSLERSARESGYVRDDEVLFELR